MEDTIKVMEQQMFQKMVWLNRLHTQDKVDLLNALRERYGEEIIELVEKTECEKAQSEWKNIAQQFEDHSIDALLKLFWEPLKAKGFEYTSEKKEDGIQMWCTKCPVYDLAKELNATDWMYHHTCCADPFIAEGFNPKIGFKRTKTLMQGDEYCDHFYYRKE